MFARMEPAFQLIHVLALLAQQVMFAKMALVYQLTHVLV
jgi:hypothetical protein